MIQRGLKSWLIWSASSSARSQCSHFLWSKYLNVTDGRTDRLTCHSSTVLCVASRGKNNYSQCWCSAHVIVIARLWCLSCFSDAHCFTPGWDPSWLWCLTTPILEGLSGTVVCIMQWYFRTHSFETVELKRKFRHRHVKFAGIRKCRRGYSLMRTRRGWGGVVFGTFFWTSFMYDHWLSVDVDVNFVHRRRSRGELTTMNLLRSHSGCHQCPSPAVTVTVTCCHRHPLWLHVALWTNTVSWLLVASCAVDSLQSANSRLNCWQTELIYDV